MRVKGVLLLGTGRHRPIGRHGAVEVGTRMTVEGMVGVHKSRLAILNPTYHLLA